MDRMLEAIDTSIAHWEENVEKAYAGTLDGEDTGSDECALCARDREISKNGLDDCDHCALSWFGVYCNDNDSIWRDVRFSLTHGTRQSTICCAELMLQSLVLVRLAYVDFFGEV